MNQDEKLLEFENWLFSLWRETTGGFPEKEEIMGGVLDKFIDLFGDYLNQIKSVKRTQKIFIEEYKGDIKIEWGTKSKEEVKSILQYVVSNFDRIAKT